MWVKISNQDIAVLKSEKEVELKYRNSLFDTEWLEQIAGVSLGASGNVVVSAIETGAAATNQITISGTPKTGEPIKIVKPDGTQIDGTYATGKVTGTNLTDGVVYTVIYKKQVTGTSLTMNAGVFSEGYSVEYRTIGYDPKTLSVACDVYFYFPKVQAADDFDLSFENGKVTQ